MYTLYTNEFGTNLAHVTRAQGTNMQHYYENYTSANLYYS